MHARMATHTCVKSNAPGPSVVPARARVYFFLIVFFLAHERLGEHADGFAANGVAGSRRAHARPPRRCRDLSKRDPRREKKTGEARVRGSSF